MYKMNDAQTLNIDGNLFNLSHFSGETTPRLLINKTQSVERFVGFQSSANNSANTLYLGELFDSSSEKYDTRKPFHSFSKETDEDDCQKEELSGSSFYCEPYSDFSQKSHTNGHDEDNSKPTPPRNTINAMIVNLFENPDQRMTTINRISIVIYTAYESYRTIISSYLIVFVPQNCGGYSCTILENLRPTNDYEITALAFNTIMAVYFCALFYVERERENAIGMYLVSDNKSPTDKEYLIRIIDEMAIGPKRKIMRLNNLYRFLVQNILLCFFVNVGVSCVVIYNNYLNNTTFIVFITNALFMINRIYKALKITSSGEYNIYSAYRTEQMLYNRDRSSWLQHETTELEHRIGVGPVRFIDSCE